MEAGYYWKKNIQKTCIKLFQRVKQRDKIKEAGVQAACLGNNDYTKLDGSKSTKR